MNLAEIRSKLKRNLPKERFIHSLGTMEISLKLAERYGVDKEKACIAALLHDCAKDICYEETLNLCKENQIELDGYKILEPILIHAELGAFIAKRDYMIEDEEILSAIKYHTIGRPNMSMLEKVIFIADYIEPNREHKEADLAREVVFEDINKAIVICIKKTIEYVKNKGGFVHPDSMLVLNSLEAK